MTLTSFPRALVVVATLLALTFTGWSSADAVGMPESAPASSATSVTAGRAADVTYQNVEERLRVAIPIVTVRTADLPRGVRRVARWGRPGVRVVTWRVKLRDGRPVARRQIRDAVVQRPISRIVRVGTGTPGGSRCDSNYRGACVPIASDVDCAGGSGNGPRYVDGPVYVVDHDIYGLDSDGDGVGCE